ncbi:hypothetical protein K2173_020220 [Erythroxylum novogranatense]|uniref:DUF4283 domain-containing protein n=1 Tax=Erythroxylum novogranatense TaxID=1862640 RepID=A0AAV8U8K8_9ROSI|nr:hypothetical protein K2173_020220 [Erythroxylum novogranatense]
MGVDRGAIEAIPLWVQFHDLPMEYWTVDGLSHLASGIGKQLCMDSHTAAMDRIGYAKICIEVPKDFVLPDSLSIKRLDENGEILCDNIAVSYPWKPKAVGRKWVATGRVFKTGWFDDLDRVDRSQERQVQVQDSQCLVAENVDLRLGGQVEQIVNVDEAMPSQKPLLCRSPTQVPTAGGLESGLVVEVGLGVSSCATPPREQTPFIVGEILVSGASGAREVSVSQQVGDSIADPSSCVGTVSEHPLELSPPSVGELMMVGSVTGLFEVWIVVSSICWERSSVSSRIQDALAFCNSLPGNDIFAYFSVLTGLVEHGYLKEDAW